ncbi:MAG: class I SAM-dependent methyltransferase [Victivallales bacterium]|nr:class I SAM-dependent methyltransferase [Victivallales bacterium]
MSSSFDSAAADWDKKAYRAEYYSVLAGHICSAMPLSKKWRALEYGCGTASLSMLLSEKLGSVVCADNSAGMIEEANRRIAERKIRNLSAKSLDIEKDATTAGEYDLIFSSLTLHHVADASGFLARLASMLKIGGWLALADLEEEDGSFHSDCSVPHKGFSPEVISAQLAELGFCDISSRTVYGIPREHRDYPVFLIAGRKRTAD